MPLTKAVALLFQFRESRVFFLIYVISCLPHLTGCDLHHIVKARLILCINKLHIALQVLVILRITMRKRKTGVNPVLSRNCDEESNHICHWPCAGKTVRC